MAAMASPVVKPGIVWFRDDLRLRDNPALHAACQAGAPVLCLYIHEPAGAGRRQPEGAALWWLHGSLAALDAALRERGGRLHVLAGAAEDVLNTVVDRISAGAVYWNRRYDPVGRDIDTGIKARLRDRGIEAHSFNGSLLREPWTISSQSGAPYRVFGAFWRAFQQGAVEPPLPAPAELSFAPLPQEIEQHLAYPFGLEPDPQRPDWAAAMRANWTRGEEAGLACLQDFLDEDLAGYADNRDRLDGPTTSRLSPYLHAGNVSVRQLWHALSGRQHGGMTAGDRDVEKFRSELGWREFSYSLLYHCPPLHEHNLQPDFDAMPWRGDHQNLVAWKQGMTGYPVVDAAMRQLWATGWMHNRARMIVASFLVKHLLIDWREGERWFWETLADADPANNPASWQWVTGSGADAAPYFRIFNPVTQGEKFDPDGVFVKRWVPELARLPASVIHRPWTASSTQLDAAGIRLGRAYPLPIVDHKVARERALAAWRSLRS
ncbi:deoxyribodipyrimidine photo-lyase [Labrys sp. ZIDIC5]|uniref:cryptochrome/photolyase family protein n=1 Tax=Labrys sedimenti TaxID=3106036 RepID=UPI002ACA8A1D|nr:deoxyribodipyrimidine photo-lyase [Labrys sp. ZIDIC5]MDZ5449206.1 deoxyribodipyrimidine photo-lyase [Labrys sp. ZIDIC5]